ASDFDRSLSFDAMREKHDKSGTGLRNIQYEGDPGYYYRGKPGGGMEKFTPQSWEILRSTLSESISARRLFDEYGFEEVHP
ncbi:hypothetical protein NL361_28880, partial [Klebsiella pneumoniae]|nr:hypothetical protein [Klebsiella pneumoniae]